MGASFVELETELAIVKLLFREQVDISIWHHMLYGDVIMVRDLANLIQSELRSLTVPPCVQDYCNRITELTDELIQVGKDISNSNSCDDTDQYTTYECWMDYANVCRNQRIYFSGDIQWEFFITTSPIPLAISWRWLRKCINMLVANSDFAMQNMPRKKITISCDIDPTNTDKVKILVEDTGKGIRPEIQSQLFHRKVQSDKGSGLGQGLLIVS